MQSEQTYEDTLNSEQLQQREQAMWKLRLRGWHQERIAEHFSVEQSTVSRTLKRVRQRLAAEFTTETIERIAEQTEQLYYIISESLDAWDYTKPQPAPASQQEPVQDEAQASQHANHSPSQNPTNPSSDERESSPTPNAKRQTPQSAHVYLRVALQALNALRQLWGLTASHKASLSAPTEYVQPQLSPTMERFYNEIQNMREHGLPHHLNRRKSETISKYAPQYASERKRNTRKRGQSNPVNPAKSC